MKLRKKEDCTETRESNFTTRGAKRNSITVYQIFQRASECFHRGLQGVIMMPRWTMSRSGERELSSPLMMGKVSATNGVLQSHSLTVIRLVILIVLLLLVIIIMHVITMARHIAEIAEVLHNKRVDTTDYHEEFLTDIDNVNNEIEDFRYDVAVMTFPGRQDRKAILEQTIRRIIFETPRNVGIYVFSGVHEVKDGGSGDEEMFELIDELCSGKTSSEFKMPEGELLFYTSKGIDKGALSHVCRIEGVLLPLRSTYIDVADQSSGACNPLFCFMQ